MKTVISLFLFINFLNFSLANNLEERLTILNVEKTKVLEQLNLAQNETIKNRLNEDLNSLDREIQIITEQGKLTDMAIKTTNLKPKVINKTNTSKDYESWDVFKNFAN